MKTISIIRILGIFALLWCVCAGCEKEIDSWSGNDGVYFGVRKKASLTTWSNELYDTTFCSFTFAPLGQPDSLIRIRVDVQGKVSRVDREVAWMVADSSTAVKGEDYVLVNEKLIMPADSTHAWLEVRLKRTDILQTGQRVLSFRLLENEHFGLYTLWYQYPNSKKRTPLTIHHIVFSDMMTDWPEALRNIMKSNWGTFSRPKLEFICLTAKLEPADFNDKNIMTPGRISYITQRVQKELDARMVAGNPVMDGDQLMSLKK